jgi:hypothetical protein
MRRSEWNINPDAFERKKGTYPDDEDTIPGKGQ